VTRRIHTEEVDGHWVIADGSGWLPGIYDSKKTAMAARRLGWEIMEGLAHIYRFDGQDRPVTMEDLKAAR
jgi:hypothetical protein